MSNAQVVPDPIRGRSTLRQKILGFVCALIVLSLLGSTISLYRITEMNHLLDVINRVSVPLGRLFIQMQSDADLYHREFERSLGASHWKDPPWSPKPVPRWVTDVLDTEVRRTTELVASDADWAPRDTRARWQDWTHTISKGLIELSQETTRLQSALEQKDELEATRSYQRWNALFEEWSRDLQSGAGEYDRSFRQNFSLAESRVTELRTGLEMILVVVVSLSLLLLWLGERALRPLGELTQLAREITRRGLRKEHKSLLPQIQLGRTDEVSQLALEFHHMATALLEREKTVEAQKHRLQEQNTLLRRMGELNENVLHSIESILLVTDLHGVITQCNPVAARWIGESPERLRGQRLLNIAKICAVFESHPEAREWLEGQSSAMGRQSLRSTQARAQGRAYAGHLMPLRAENGTPSGAILVLDDVTEDLELQERLRSAEHMAAVGRMSAQVAHEVRNPLHSIGLEAEVAGELASRLENAPVKQSLRQSIGSILGSVERLEKITDNYLKLSRLTSGKKRAVDLSSVLMSVLATYAPVCESQGVQVNWSCERKGNLQVWGDQDLLENALGNLFRNSLQALESAHGSAESKGKEIEWRMGSTETGRIWINIEDNGPGVDPAIASRLFDPFVTTRAQGTGLGLSFVKRVMEEHGGEISLKPSQGGACFEMMLPALEPDFVLARESSLATEGRGYPHA